MLPTLARGLHVRRQRGEPLVARISAALQGKPTLLVLDNFEQLVPAAPDLAELLAACPRLKVLVTSRAVLQVRGEHDWPVPALALPVLARQAELGALATCPSMALLLDRARVIDPTLSLTRTNAATLAAICVRLEGIPLAIELAATWLKLFSPEMLLQRLERRLPLLRGGTRDLPDRHQTLASAIAWSDALLTSEERRLFQNLAVFVDGWTLEAAQTVCALDADEADQHAIEDNLASLLRKSLIQRETGADGKVRFRMLELIREYALTRLETGGAANALRERHAGYYLALVEEAAAHLYRADQAVWMERLEQELSNLLAALRWLIDRGEGELALRCAVGLENFWLVHDHLITGQRWLEEILAMPGLAYPRLQARARRCLAALLLRQGDYARARALYAMNVKFGREVGDDAFLAQTLLDLGSLDFISGDLDQARAHFEEALALGWNVEDHRTVAQTLNQLGELARFTGDEAGAAARYQQSLALWRALAEKERIAMVLRNLAPIIARQGDHRRAAALFSESLGLSWELRNTHGVALCLMGIAGAVSRGWATALRAAHLLGAAEALRASIGVQWEPVDRAEYERSVAACRTYLDSSAFATGWEHGQTLTLAEAVDLAMGLLAAHADAERAPKAKRPHRDPAFRGLTRREYEVVLQVALGKTNREIADTLFIAERTVETHVSHSLDKLGLRSRAQLAAWVAGQAPLPGSSVAEHHPR